MHIAVEISTKMQNCIDGVVMSVLWWEQVEFLWDDDVCFVLNHCLVGFL